MGAALYPEQGTADALLQCADDAMYPSQTTTEGGGERAQESHVKLNRISVRMITMTILNPLIKTGFVALLLTLLAVCQSVPQGLTAEQVATLRERGFHLTDEGWTPDISNKVLFANNVGALNPETRQVVEKLGKALIEVD